MPKSPSKKTGKKPVKNHRIVGQKVGKNALIAKETDSVHVKSRFHFLIKFRRLLLFLFIIGIVSSILFYYFILKDLPSPYSLATSKTPLTTTIRDRNGKILYRIYKNANRLKLNWDDIPDILKNATLAIEDANFYHHYGISPKAIIRALVYNWQQKNISLYQGGSTITQQLVKNKLLEPKKNYMRKIREIILSLVVERIYSKNDILTMYLNEVGYGGPAYGVGAASQMYFGIPAKDITLAQAALLAGLPAAPTTFSPFGVNPQLAVVRQQEVLNRMRKLEMIDETEYKSAMEEKLQFAPQRIDILAPHFVMFVKNQLVEKLGEDVVEEGGLDVTTTLDLEIQSKAEDIVSKNVEEIKDKYNIHNAATVVTSPTTGEVLAMVGSADYWDIKNQGYVNVANSLRQPGSAIKVVNYAYAFDHNWSPTSTIEDSPVVYVARGSTESYAPQNYDGKFHGIVTLRSALANSYNVPAVKLLNTYGIDQMIELGKAMGVKSWENIPPIGLSLTLGGAEVTMLDMSRVFGTIANMGVRRELKFIREIKDSTDKVITKRLDTPKESNIAASQVNAENNLQVISPLAAYWLTDILADNNARLPAFGYYSKLTVANHKVAVKTGTSNSYRDNWTIGFTPDYLVATWVGNTDGSFMNKNLTSGITGAAPIWNEVITSLIANLPDREFPKPEGLIPIKICAVNGLLTCPYCPLERTEYFTADKVPTKKCSFRAPNECEEAKKLTEGKSEEEKKQIMSGCPVIN